LLPPPSTSLPPLQPPAANPTDVSTSATKDPHHLRRFSSLHCLHLLRRGRCMQNPSISACSGRIIKLSLGRASFGPAQMAGSGPAPIKKKSKKISKIILKKICDFSRLFFYQLCIISGCIFTL
jgi:hypothetical protein